MNAESLSKEVMVVNPKLKIASVLLISALLLVLILFPSTADIEKYQMLYDRGNIEEAQAGLKSLLDRDESLYEARELLAQIYMDNRQFDQALEQIIILYGQDPSTQAPRLQLIRSSLLRWAQQNPNPELAQAGLELTRQAIVDYPHWPWISEVHLDLAISAQMTDEIIPAFQHHFTLTSTVSSQRESRAWELFREKRDFVNLFTLAQVMETPERRTTVSAITDIIRFGSHQDLEEIWQLYPDNSLLTVNVAQYMEPREGLNMLKQWEMENGIRESDQRSYSHFKLNLLIHADSISILDLDNVLPEDLLDLALEVRTTQPEKSTLVADHLVGLGYAKDILEAGYKISPYKVLDGSAPWLSPDGRWLAVTKEDNRRVTNLETGSQFSISLPNDREGDYRWLWSPDMKHVAIGTKDTGGIKDIMIYNANGNISAKPDLSDESFHNVVIGWRDNDSLWIKQWVPVADGLNVGPILWLDLSTNKLHGNTALEETGTREWLPGPNGSLVWHHWLNRETYIFHDGNITLIDDDTIPLGGLEPVSWSPDGNSLLLWHNQMGLGYYLYEDETLKPLDFSGTFLGWKDSTQFYWKEPLKIDDETLRYHVLKGFDIETGEETNYGTIGRNLQAAGNLGLVWEWDTEKVLLYKLD